MRAAATTQVRALGANYQPPASVPHHAAISLTRILSDSVSSATHDALLFAAAVVFVGGCLSWLIPSSAGRHLPESAEPDDQALEEMAEELSAFVPLDPEGELLDGGPDHVPVAEHPS